MSVLKQRHSYDRDSSSDTEDYPGTDEGRRSFYHKNRLRYIKFI